MPDKRLTSKELACELRRSPAYVSLMRRAGFRMVGGMATLPEALAWLAVSGFSCTCARRFPCRRAAVNSIKSAGFRGV